MAIICYTLREGNKMCQAKSKGGKRCFAHMLGTQASVIMASIMGNVPQEHAKKVSSELRKEGKGLPAPTEEEILAFARNNQFISRHDITIPDNMRAGLVKRWQKAEMERPDGGGFHAWKHVLVESVVRYRRTAAAVGLAGLMTFSTACSGGQDIGNAPENTSSPSPSISQTGPAGPSITGGKVIKTEKGEYLQSTISPDDPAMKYDPSVAIGNPEDYVSREQIEKGQDFTVKFVAEEVIDSSLNNGAGNTDKWWNENKNKFDPTYHTAIREDLDKTDGPVVQNKWHKDVVDYDYNYVYSKNETRISDRDIKVYEVYHSENNMLVFKTKYDYTAKVQTPDGIGYEKVSGDYVVGLIPSDKDESGWAISHYSSKYDVNDFIEPVK